MYSNYTNNQPPVQIEVKPIKNEYIPLKTTDVQHKTNKAFIEGMTDNNNIIQYIINEQRTEPQKCLQQEQQKESQLILKDDITTRLFIGGISVIGLIAFFNLLYKPVK